MITALVLIVLALTAVSQAMVCPPDYCRKVECMPIKQCVGKLVRNGSFCRCCDVCKTVLEPGDNCFQMFLLGVPSTVVCPDNHHCDDATLTCKPNA